MPDGEGYQVFVTPDGTPGYVYEMHCPMCGGPFVTLTQVSVSQNGVQTIIGRHGDTVHEEDTSLLPGALINMLCACDEGHEFVLGFLHNGRCSVVYAGTVQKDDSPPEPLWVNPEQIEPEQEGEDYEPA